MGTDWRLTRPVRASATPPTGDGMGNPVVPYSDGRVIETDRNDLGSLRTDVSTPTLAKAHRHSRRREMTYCTRSRSMWTPQKRHRGVVRACRRSSTEACLVGGSGASPAASLWVHTGLLTVAEPECQPTLMSLYVRLQEEVRRQIAWSACKSHFRTMKMNPKCGPISGVVSPCEVLSFKTCSCGHVSSKVEPYDRRMQRPRGCKPFVRNFKTGVPELPAPVIPKPLKSYTVILVNLIQVLPSRVMAICKNWMKKAL
jgi:hypothetical protein